MSRPVQRMIASLLCWNWLACLLAISQAQAQTAQQAHEAMRKSIVQLEATGQGTVGPATGTNVGGSGTGFLVSGDGYLLTSYHILEKIEAAQGINLDIKATLLDGTGTKTVSAKVVNAAPMLDLLLLKVPESLVQPYSFVKMGESRSLTNGDDILASGYHNGQRFTRSGKLSNRDLHYWNIEMPIVGGYSGSPIYRASGEVVGLIKGNLTTDPNIGIMVPIELADPLIGSIRNAELRAKLDWVVERLGDIPDGQLPIQQRLVSVEGSLQDVSKHLNWGAKVTEAFDIQITYEKLVSGKPHVASIDYKIAPFVKLKNGEVKLKEVFAESNAIRGLAPEDSNFGDFLIEQKDYKKDMEGSAKPTDVVGIVGLFMSIIPKLDGSQIPEKSREIKFEFSDEQKKELTRDAIRKRDNEQ